MAKSRLKTPWKLQQINTLAVKNVDIKNLLNTDQKLIDYVDLAASLLGEIQVALDMGDGTNIPKPLPFPMASRLWTGQLEIDVTYERTSAAGHKYNAYTHQPDMTEIAQNIRERTQELLAFYDMQNDLMQINKKPNRGGLAGSRIGTYHMVDGPAA